MHLNYAVCKILFCALFISSSCFSAFYEWEVDANRRAPMRVLSANAKGVFENAIFTLTVAYEWCTGKWIREGLQTGGLCIVATPPLLDDFLEAIENAAWDESLCSGRANFWGDAYTVRKWTRNLRTKNRKCVPTKRNETNDAFQKDLYYRVHQTIQRKKMFANDARFPLQYSRSFRNRLHRVYFKTVESRFFRKRYASLPWFCVQLDFGA